MTDPLPRTQALLAEGVRTGLHPGAQLYVSVHGRTVADLAVGEAREGVAMTPQTVNLWFSSGKPLTTVAVARLWEQGALDLEAPVSQWIPEFAVLGKDAIRARHLLEHTAGFRSADRVPADLGWGETIQAICAAPLEPDWVPGRRAGYQLFSSWYILAELVRRIDGRPIDRWVRDEIYTPLALADCWMGLPEEAFVALGDRLGLMHFQTQGRLRPHPVWNQPRTAAAVRPGGNLRGPIRALGRFYESLLGVVEAGPRLLAAATVAEFSRRQRVGLWDETFAHVLDWGWGFGVNSNRHGAETVPYGFGRHASERAFGHGGSQSSCGFADPAHGLAGAWICNGMIGEPAHQRRARAIQEAIYQDLGLA
jgi:CubicO group peptidase (beta-lactamase class C family)